MNKNILIVDDDADIRTVVRMFLEKAGYAVEEKADGGFMNEIDTSTIPGMYILDRDLKGEDGLTLCNRLKNNPKTKDVPVIMLSADPFISNLYKMAGADDYIEKPFKSSNLIKTVSHYLGQ